MNSPPPSWRRRFNTQPPEGGCVQFGGKAVNQLVSTHSRPKAAGGGAGVV